MIAFMDLETYSPVPIANGTHAYAEQAEVLLFAYAFDDGPVHCWDVTTGEPMPAPLAQALADPSVLTVWHNGGMFDRVVLKHAMGIDLPTERIHDTMVQAMCHALPGSLDKLGEVMGLEMRKDKRGGQLIQLFCKPRPKNMKLRRATRETHPREWAEFIEYATADIPPMRELYKKLPRWNYSGAELDLWRLDQTINMRGVQVDTALATAALRASDRAQASLAERTDEMTAGAVQAATQRDKLLKYLLAEHGVVLDDLQTSTLETVLAKAADLSPEVRELLTIRLQASRTSASKYKTLLKGVSRDGRLRGLLQFCGASRTGRWAGRLFQPQNLPRPTLKDKHINLGIDAMLADCEDLLFTDVMELCASAIRGCIVAPQGKKLVVADLSNIEGRMLAWLAGEQWKLKAFADYDAGTGHDLYALAYAKAFNVTPEAVMDNKKNGDGSMRQIGKVMELACFTADTLVLTEKKGYIPILDVCAEDRLWDGKQWVRHAGVVERPARQVVNVAGIRATPDHLMLTGQTWKQAGLLATSESILCQALVTGSENLPLSAITSALRVALLRLSRCNVRAALHLTKSTITTCARVVLRAATSAPKSRPDTTARAFGGMPTLYRLMTTGGACSAEYPPASIGATTRKTAGTQAMAGAEFTFMSFGEKTAARFLSTLSPSPSGITPILSWIESTWTKAMNLATCVSSAKQRIKQTAAKFGLCKKQSCDLSKRLPVYDILLAGPRSRFTILSDRGPIIAHNCGYQGGVGAWITFAAAYGIDLSALSADGIPDSTLAQARDFMEWLYGQDKKTNPQHWLDQGASLAQANAEAEIHRKAARYGLSEQAFIVCDSFKRLWREAHPETVSWWREVEDAARSAIQNPGSVYQARRVKFVRTGAWLRCTLPSGRQLCYPSAKVDEDSGQITYMGVNQYSRKWERLKTYAGKLVENIVQAAARDVLAHGMQNAENVGYLLTLSVHDELITETPDTDEFTAEGLASIMASVPPWAQGLPLAAEGFEDYRYHK